MGQYLPNAGDQVIMLCTDTELTDDIAALIKPHVSQNYKIGVTDTGDRTSITKQELSNEMTDKKVLLDAR